MGINRLYTYDRYLVIERWNHLLDVADLVKESVAILFQIHDCVWRRLYPLLVVLCGVVMGSSWHVFACLHDALDVGASVVRVNRHPLSRRIYELRMAKVLVGRWQLGLSCHVNVDVSFHLLFGHGIALIWEVEPLVGIHCVCRHLQVACEHLVLDLELHRHVANSSQCHVPDRQLAVSPLLSSLTRRPPTVSCHLSRLRALVATSALDGAAVLSRLRSVPRRRLS